MIRKTIITLLSLIILAGAYMVFQNVSNKKNTPRKVKPQKITQVLTETVQNRSVAINIQTNGTLRAKKRLELFAEVNGVFESSTHSFKPGVYYAANDTLISIESRQQELNLKAQKSNLYNQLVLMLPDLRFDYPESVGHWEQYISNYDVEGDIKPFPTEVDDREKLFIAGRNIKTSYYTIKNLEEQLSRHTISAPFNGILVETMIEPGTAIRTGQQLGTFISPYTYELEVAINTSYDDFLRIGKSVELFNIDRSKSWTGKVRRINSKVDPNSQTIPVFVEVGGKGLKEGMYLEADLTAKEEKDVFEIDRKLLVGENQIFTVVDSLLQLTGIEPVYFKDETVLVRGLENGVNILANTIPGAHEGMIVRNISL